MSTIDTTARSAMKLALEALVAMSPSGPTGSLIWHQQMYAITALREALNASLAERALDKMAENARELGLDYEPVQDGGIVTAGGFDPRTRRTWVGLTDEEITDIWAEASPYYHEDDFARAIEAKLKEKNNV